MIALLALSGCAGGTPGGAGADSSSPNAPAPLGEAEFQSARDAYDLRLAECLREAGFTVKDPEPGQGIQETGEGLEAAASTCMAEIGEPPRSDSRVDVTELLESALEEAECLRGRGLEVEEPQLGQTFTLPADASDEDIAACIDPA
jgi:hypothetical protein